MKFFILSQNPPPSHQAWCGVGLGGCAHRTYPFVLLRDIKLNHVVPHTLMLPFPTCSLLLIPLGKAHLLFRTHSQGTLSREPCLMTPGERKPLPLMSPLSHSQIECPEQDLARPKAWLRAGVQPKHHSCQRLGLQHEGQARPRTSGT